MNEKVSFENKLEALGSIFQCTDSEETFNHMSITYRLLATELKAPSLVPTMSLLRTLARMEGDTCFYVVRNFHRLSSINKRGFAIKHTNLAICFLYISLIVETRRPHEHFEIDHSYPHLEKNGVISSRTQPKTLLDFYEALNALRFSWDKLCPYDTTLMKECEAYVRSLIRCMSFLSSQAHSVDVMNDALQKMQRNTKDDDEVDHIGHLVPPHDRKNKIMTVGTICKFSAILFSMLRSIYLCRVLSVGLHIDDAFPSEKTNNLNDSTETVGDNIQGWCMRASTGVVLSAIHAADFLGPRVHEKMMRWAHVTIGEMVAIEQVQEKTAQAYCVMSMLHGDREAYAYSEDMDPEDIFEEHSTDMISFCKGEEAVEYIMSLKKRDMRQMFSTNTHTAPDDKILGVSMLLLFVTIIDRLTRNKWTSKSWCSEFTLSSGELHKLHKAKIPIIVSLMGGYAVVFSEEQTIWCGLMSEAIAAWCARVVGSEALKMISQNQGFRVKERAIKLMYEFALNVLNFT